MSSPTEYELNSINNWCANARKQVWRADGRVNGRTHELTRPFLCPPPLLPPRTPLAGYTFGLWIYRYAHGDSKFTVNIDPTFLARPWPCRIDRLFAAIVCVQGPTMRVVCVLFYGVTLQALSKTLHFGNVLFVVCLQMPRLHVMLECSKTGFIKISSGAEA